MDGGSSRRDVFSCTVIQWRGRVSHDRAVSSRATIDPRPAFSGLRQCFSEPLINGITRYPCGATNSTVAARSRLMFTTLLRVYQAHARITSSSLKFNLVMLSRQIFWCLFINLFSIIYRGFRDSLLLSVCYWRNIALCRIT